MAVPVFPSDSFPGNCLPHIVQIPDSCGCTLTRASILGMTPQTFANLGITEIEMHRVIARSQEARMAGAIESNMSILLKSRMKPIKDAVMQQKIGPNESLILPYVYRRQKRNINANYWRIASGVVDPNAGVGSVPASCWDITVQVSQSPWATPLPNIANYFLPGKYISLFNSNATTGVAQQTVYKILSSTENDVGGTVQAILQIQPNVTDATWAGYTSAQKLPFQPIQGTFLIMSNSVSDYESWCYNQPSVNPNNLLSFWLQTTRETHCFNDEYVRVLNDALMSGYFTDFATLPLAEQKRQQYALSEREFNNACFWGQEINENQTVENYRNLPQVVDPNNPNCVLEYKANMLGFDTMLANCGRKVDLQGATLSMDYIAAQCYQLKRYREATGQMVDRVDWMTDRFTAGLIDQLMTSFYTNKYGVQSTRFYQPNQALTYENVIRMPYAVYQLPPDLGGLEMSIFYDQFFDDRLSAMDNTTLLQNRGRTMMALDWTDVEIGIAGANSATRQTNIAADLYNCVIRPNVNHYQLNSTTATAIIEDPNRHSIVNNFSSACPTITVSKCQTD